MTEYLLHRVHRRGSSSGGTDFRPRLGGPRFRSNGSVNRHGAHGPVFAEVGPARDRLRIDGAPRDTEAGEPDLQFVVPNEHSGLIDALKSVDAGSARPRWKATGPVRLISAMALKAVLIGPAARSSKTASRPDSPQRARPVYPADAGQGRACRTMVPACRSSTGARSREALKATSAEPEGTPCYYQPTSAICRPAFGQLSRSDPETAGVEPHEVILVGNDKEDMLAGGHNKLLFFGPNGIRASMNMAFEVRSISELAQFCELFGLRQHPIFWAIDREFFRSAAWGRSRPCAPRFCSLRQRCSQCSQAGVGAPRFWFLMIVSSLYFSGFCVTSTTCARSQATTLRQSARCSRAWMRF